MPIPRADFLHRRAGQPPRPPAIDHANAEAGILVLATLAANRGDFFAFTELVAAVDAKALASDGARNGFAVHMSILCALEGLMAAGQVEAQMLAGATYYARPPDAAA